MFKSPFMSKLVNSGKLGLESRLDIIVGKYLSCWAQQVVSRVTEWLTLYIGDKQTAYTYWESEPWLNPISNGLNGDIVKESQQPSNLPLKYYSLRVRRTRLQSALRDQVPEGIIQLNKRLVFLDNLEDGKSRLSFEDGTQTTVDLVVGADGIRSVCFLYSSR